ncbi:MAG TPA: PD-(D/E)XK nuclease family protein [Thermoanaerobaculia bacterium]
MPPLLHFASYREIAEEIAARLAASSSGEVIVSSYGLATTATAELLRRSKIAAVSVRLSLLDTFARRVVNDAGEYPRVAAEAERHLAMRAAVRAIDDPMMETRGIVAMMERSYRDVRDGGMTLAEFDRRSRTKTLRNHQRTQMILGIWREYERLIAHLQAVDPADILDRAAVLIESGKVSVPAQVIAGFYDMTGAQLRILHALKKTGKVSAIFVPAGEDAAYAFASRFVGSVGAMADRLKPVLHIKKPEATVAQCGNKEMELRAVCHSIRELLDSGVPADRIGITTRALDPDDLRLLDRFAGELGFRISERIETSLPGHRIGRGVATILRLRDKNFPRADVIDILRDGYQPRKRVDIDGIDIATRKARVSGGRSIDVRNAANDPYIEDYRAVVEELEFVGGLRQIAERFRVESEVDLAVAAAIDDIAALLDRWGQRVDAETLIELLDQQTLPRQPATDNREPIVWAGDVMQFRGRNFDHLFVIRAQEATFPQRRVDDPLLPDSDRRELGIREIGDGRDEERLLFQLLLDGAATIRFSFSSSDTFGKILRPSRMLKEFGPPQHMVVPPDNRQPTTDNLFRQLQLIVRAGTQSVFDGYLGADENVLARIRSALQELSPTQLENFGECPQKFLLKHILDVQDYDDPDRELQMHRREKGKLDHTILERFYKSVDVLPPPDLYKRIDAIIEDAFDEEETRVPAFNRVMRNIERKATKRNLHAFLADDIADLQASGLRPKHFEYKFGGKHAKRGATADHPDPFVISAHDVEIRVEGSIDRIDEGFGKIRIVDYKSGKALRHVHLAEKIDRGVRLQLALYAMAVAEFFGAHEVSGAIKPLVVRGTDPEKLCFDLAESAQRLRETLDLFVASMLRGAFPAFPNDNGDGKDYDACKYCPVNHSCRTKHSEAERRIVLRSRDPRTLLETMS